MNLNDYSSLLGQLIGNFHCLESALRSAIFNNKKRDENKPEINLDNLSEGDIVEEDAFTDYSTLSQLIEKYNNIVNDLNNKVDSDIVKLRDALAHGRVFSLDMQLPLKLLKFDKPINSQVKVTFAQNMTEEWLNEHINKVHKELMKVVPLASKPRNNIT